MKPSLLSRIQNLERTFGSTGGETQLTPDELKLGLPAFYVALNRDGAEERIVLSRLASMGAKNPGRYVAKLRAHFYGGVELNGSGHERSGFEP